MKEAGSVLTGLIARLTSQVDTKTLKKMKGFNSMTRSWVDIAGEDLAAHSSVTDIKSGTVYIQVDHPGWMQMLKMQERKILASLKKKYKELHIQNINYRLENKHKQTAHQKDSLKIRKETLSSEDIKIDPENTVKKVDDERLKNALEALKSSINKKKDINTDKEN